MEHRTKNRVRLWLRAEQAMGIKSVVAPPATEGNEAQPQAIVEEKPVAKATASSVNLFGTGEAARSLGAVPATSAFSEPFTSPLLSTSQKQQALTEIDANQVKGCTACRLCEKRTNTVFGEGDVDAKIVFIGEGPGENEDLTGRPFVGRAGELLNKMIAGMGLKRDDVYICNIVKCRPPGNRAPVPDEVAACTPYLEKQLEIIRPQVIVTLGLPAAQYMLQTKNSMGRMRGQWHTWRGIKLMPTYHPAYVLRSYTTEVRAAVWSDLQKVMVEIGLPMKAAKAAP